MAQKSINIVLKQQLDTILQTDQGIREFLDTEVTAARKDTLTPLLNYPRVMLDKNPWTVMRKIDSTAMIKDSNV